MNGGDQVREGNRGGAGLFKWTDVAGDKHRENYLGHSVNAPVGRWQKHKDISWYTKDAKPSDAAAAEIATIKQREEEALALALGYKPTEKKTELDPEEQERKVVEKAERKALKRIEKEERRQRKESRRAERSSRKGEARSKSRSRSISRSRSPQPRRSSRSPRRITSRPRSRSPPPRRRD